MPAPTPTITARDAHVAILMLDTRVGTRWITRTTLRSVAPPLPLTARRVAVRLTEAAGETISPADDVVGAHRALRSAIPTHELRAIAAAS